MGLRYQQHLPALATTESANRERQSHLIQPQDNPLLYGQIEYIHLTILIGITRYARYLCAIEAKGCVRPQGDSCHGILRPGRQIPFKLLVIPPIGRVGKIDIVYYFVVRAPFRR